MSRTNGHLRPVAPASAMVSFGQVADLLRQKDPAAGFTRAAEILLDNFQSLKAEFGAAPLIKLAIDLHKHGLFCEVAGDKTRTAHDAAAYEMYQKYLAGDSDMPVAAGLNPTRPPTPNTVIEMENSDDGEEPEQHRQ